MLTKTQELPSMFLFDVTSFFVPCFFSLNAGIKLYFNTTVAVYLFLLINILILWFSFLRCFADHASQYNLSN